MGEAMPAGSDVLPSVVGPTASGGPIVDQWLQNLRDRTEYAVANGGGSGIPHAMSGDALYLPGDKIMDVWAIYRPGLDADDGQWERLGGTASGDHATHCYFGLGPAPAPSSAETLSLAVDIPGYTVVRVGHCTTQVDDVLAKWCHCGPSVGTTLIALKFSRTASIGGRIFYNGSAWDTTACVGVNSVAWQAGTNRLRINTKTGWGYGADHVTTATPAGASVLHPRVDATSFTGEDDFVEVEFFDNAGTQQTSVDTGMDFVLNIPATPNSKLYAKHVRQFTGTWANPAIFVRALVHVRPV